MSTERILPVMYKGTASLTPEKVHTITDWLGSSLNNASVATSEGDVAYYLGQSDAFEYTLALLYKQAEVAAKIVEKNTGNFKRAVMITGTVALGYYVWKNQNLIKTRFNQSVAEVKKSAKND